MSAPANAPRFPTGAAIDRLTAVLGLSSGTQDWDLEVADARRVGEFLDFYDGGVDDDDERFALMALIVASYDELLRGGGDADGRLWERIHRHLLGRFDLHAYTVQYWSLPDEDDDPDHVFPFTPRAREVMTAAYGPRDGWPRQPVSVKRFTDWPNPVVPGVPLNTMDIIDKRDGTFGLLWSKFEDRPSGVRRNFSTIADAIFFAAREFGVPPEKWQDA